MMRRLLRLAALLLSLCAMPALAQVEITADTFTLNEDVGEATFTGNVVVVRTGLTVWADKVVVDYTGGSMENIKSFVATGSVRLKTEDQEATGDRATFDPATQVLRLRGNVTVVNAAGRLTGPELEVDLANNTSVFSSGQGGRVTGVFSTQ